MNIFYFILSYEVFYYFSIRETILNAIYAHKSYWKCYQYQDTYNINSVTHNKDEIANRHVVMVTYK